MGTLKTWQSLMFTRGTTVLSMACAHILSAINSTYLDYRSQISEMEGEESEKGKLNRLRWLNPLWLFSANVECQSSMTRTWSNAQNVRSGSTMRVWDLSQANILQRTGLVADVLSKRNSSLASQRSTPPPPPLLGSGIEKSSTVYCCRCLYAMHILSAYMSV